MPPSLIVVAGPTASGKSTLAMRVATAFAGEILSCDSVAVYRGLDIGSAKPPAADRDLIPHHGLDLLWPNEPCTAGDFARTARSALEDIRARSRLPIIAGGTGLYLRATLDGLAAAPPRDEALRERLRAHAVRRGRHSLHRLLRRLDPQAATMIHANDQPKLIRSLEVSILGRQPQTEQWQTGRDPLQGFRILQLGLDPPRSALYERINSRAAAMFSRGLLEETARAASAFGENACALRSLGYLQALAVLGGRQALPDAVAEAQQGHRNYAKRQRTWFRRDLSIQWLQGFGDDPLVQEEALRRIGEHLKAEHPQWTSKEDQ